MERTLFGGLVDKYFRLVIGKVTEKTNDKSKESPLLHKTMLTEEYSADLTFGSTTLNNSIVAADVVSLDSSLPLKARGKIANATGQIPKLGIKYRKGEKDISDINVMTARGANEAEVAAKVFDDVTKVIKGIDVRTEIMFEQALSTGEALVDSDTNDGTGIRISFGYKPENTFHATNPWEKSNSNPQNDIQKLFDKANEDGNAIAHVYLSRKYFDLFRKSVTGKMLAASYLNQFYTDVKNLAVPSRSVFLEALKDEYGAEFHVVDSAFRYQKPDGTFASVHPWAEANVVATPDSIVGRLVYGTLAEETNPVAGVSYQKSGNHILVSKYSKTDPLEEFTAGQSLSIPVIDGADGIYILHADGDGAVVLDPKTLSIAKDANATGTFKITHVDGDLADVKVASDQAWLNATRSKETVTVKAQANSSAARTATVTVTSGEASATVSVTQASGEV